MLKYFIIFFDPGSNCEKLPDYLSFKNCNHILFKSLDEIDEIQENDMGLEIFWKNIKKEYNLKKKIYILIHGKSSYTDLIKILEKDSEVKLILNYSTGDPLYEDMWRDISRSKGCDDLENVLDYWLRCYSIDPLRRLKHRFINAFQSLSIDLGKLMELIEENDIVGLKKHIENLSEYWKEKNDGPLYKLINFWYALVGKDGLRWGEASLPAKPAVPLAKKNEEELTIYFHLKELFGAEKTKQMQEWVKLLDHCQLYQVCDGKFDINENISGIYMKSKELEQLIGKVLLYKEEIEELRTNEEVKELRANSEYFIKWLNKLNELIEALIKACS